MSTCGGGIGWYGCDVPLCWQDEVACLNCCGVGVGGIL